MQHLPPYPPTRVVFHSIPGLESHFGGNLALPKIKGQSGLFYCIENTTASEFFRFDSNFFFQTFHERPVRKHRANFQFLRTMDCINFVALNSGTPWLCEVGFGPIMNDFFAQRCFGEVTHTNFFRFPMRCVGFKNFCLNSNMMKSENFRNVAIKIRMRFGKRYKQISQSWLHALKSIRNLDK